MESSAGEYIPPFIGLESILSNGFECYAAFRQGFAPLSIQSHGLQCFFAPATADCSVFHALARIFALADECSHGAPDAGTPAGLPYP
jgi:hypothetical protein